MLPFIQQQDGEEEIFCFSKEHSKNSALLSIFLERQGLRTYSFQNVCMLITENSLNTIGFTYREIRLSNIMSCQHSVAYL